MKASEVANELRRIADALAGSDLDIDPFLVIHTQNETKRASRISRRSCPSRW